MICNVIRKQGSAIRDAGGKDVMNRRARSTEGGEIKVKAASRRRIPAGQVSIFITRILIRSIKFHYASAAVATGQRLKSFRIIRFTFRVELMELNITVGSR